MRAANRYAKGSMREMWALRFMAIIQRRFSLINADVLWFVKSYKTL